MRLFHYSFVLRKAIDSFLSALSLFLTSFASSRLFFASSSKSYQNYAVGARSASGEAHRRGRRRLDQRSTIGDVGRRDRQCRRLLFAAPLMLLLFRVRGVDERCIKLVRCCCCVRSSERELAPPLLGGVLRRSDSSGGRSAKPRRRRVAPQGLAQAAPGPQPLRQGVEARRGRPGGRQKEKARDKRGAGSQGREEEAAVGCGGGGRPGCRRRGLVRE